MPHKMAIKAAVQYGMLVDEGNACILHTTDMKMLRLADGVIKFGFLVIKYEMHIFAVASR